MRNIISAALLSLLPTALLADVRSDATEALMMWQPDSIAFKRGTLTVTLPQQRVTEDIYFAVLTAGICLWQSAGKDFSSVSELVVLNQHKRQGYVYERGAKDCDEINSMPAGGGGAKLHVLGATHLH